MIEKNYFELPKYIVADAGYGSEQNYDEILNVRELIPLITYNQYRKEKKRQFKPFKTANREYDEITDSFICPNNRRLNYIYKSNRTDKYGFKRTFKVYMKVKIIPNAHYDPSVQKQQKGKTENYFSINM